MSSSLVKKWTPERVAIVVRWCGGGIAVLGLLWAVHVAWFILRAQVAEGTVAQWEAVTSKGKDSNGFSTTHTTWYAEVRFKDARGVAHYAHSPRGHAKPLWPVGQPVLLYYDPADPENILISHSSSIWFPPGVILGLGLFLFLLSTLALTLLRRAAQRNAREVAEIVAKYVSKKPPQPDPSPSTFSDTALRYVAFATPPGKSFSHLGYLDSTDLVPALVEEFKKLDPAVQLLVTADDEHLILQGREKVRRLPRASIRELSVYPVLPAKASGQVQMNLELGGKERRDPLEYFMCGPYSEDLQNRCLDKARQIASMLGVPVTLLEPGHDC